MTSMPGTDEPVLLSDDRDGVRTLTLNCPRRKNAINPGLWVALRDALNSGADVDTSIVRYPEADHGFHCDARDAYHEASATDAWQHTLEWLDAHLAPVD